MRAKEVSREAGDGRHLLRRRRCHRVRRSVGRSGPAAEPFKGERNGSNQINLGDPETQGFQHLHKRQVGPIQLNLEVRFKPTRELTQGRLSPTRRLFAAGLQEHQSR